jgi:hypothetical protein
MSKVVSYVPGADLRCSHVGLTKIANRHGRDPLQLRDGQFLVFVNNARTQAKILAKDNILVHLRGEGGRKLSFAALNLLPKYFGGREFNYQGALREALTKHFERRYDS